MRGDRRMRVLYVSAEVAPFAKVGGLADVAGSLPHALRSLGVDARTIMPAYAMVESNPSLDVETVIEDFPVVMGNGEVQPAYLKKLDHEGGPIYLLGTNRWFTDSVSSETLYRPGGEMHAFFCAGVLRAMELLGWIPDILHANDWHTGFLPVLLKQKAGPAWGSTASVFTIHNQAYQGEFGLESLDWVGLPHYLFNYTQVEAWGRVNFLKSGCAFADHTTTVSPRYAEEIQTREFGHGLEGLMQHLAFTGRLTGILNGIDYDVWNPETDPVLASRFTAETIEGKALCKMDLRARLGLPESEGPIAGMVSRLSHQKGFDLILESAERLFDQGLQLVIQGLGDPAMVEAFQDLERRFPNNFRLVNRFDPDTANRIYGGADMFLMPSAFEPCGLGQMIAMRYGTVPIVRSTGGLRDTVQDEFNGFAFHERSAASLVEAVRRAMNAYKGDLWSTLRANCFATDFRWNGPAEQYLETYRRALETRNPERYHELLGERSA